jgi:hypothetical protein
VSNATLGELELESTNEGDGKVVADDKMTELEDPTTSSTGVQSFKNAVYDPELTVITPDTEVYIMHCAGRTPVLYQAPAQLESARHRATHWSCVMSEIGSIIVDCSPFGTAPHRTLKSFWHLSNGRSSHAELKEPWNKGQVLDLR